MKKLRNTSAQPPLTPDIITSAKYLFEPPLTRSEVADLYRQIGRLKSELATERRRHVRLENALHKYLAGLEKELQERGEAISVLGAELATQISAQLKPKQSERQ